MNDQQRSKELRATLLRAAKLERAPSSTRSSVRVALGLAAGAGTTGIGGASAAAGAKAVAGATSIPVLAKFVVIGAVVGGVSMGVVQYAQDQARAPAPLERSEPATSYRVLPLEPVASTPGPQASEPPPPSSSQPPALMAWPPALPVPVAASESAEPLPSLADEIALLDEARRAVRAHDSSTALRAIEAYRRAHPAGQMSAEATVLQIEALEQAGDRAGAQRLARQFAETNPKSPLLERVYGLVPDAN